jgi:beta-glucosidase
MDFPKGFLWGAATSAYQVEGGNRFSDWWEFERRYDSPCEDKCGDSTDHYHRYAADIAMLASFGLNTFRFGIEWARIEPEDGEISYAELQHYRRVLECCKANNVTPIVTFCHHTLPIWVSRKGGWIWKDAPKRFSQYCDLVTAELGDLIPYAMTINQPDLDTNLGYRYGRTYPGFMAIKTMEPDKVAAIVEPHMSQAHILAREAIRKNIPDVKVGLGLAVTDWVFDGTEEELCQQRIVKNCEGHYFALTKGDDYVGVQAYTTNYIPAGHNPDAPVSKHDFPCPPGKKLTAMGYEFAPFAVADCVRRTVSKTGLPVIVTENSEFCNAGLVQIPQSFFLPLVFGFFLEPGLEPLGISSPNSSKMSTCFPTNSETFGDLPLSWTSLTDRISSSTSHGVANRFLKPSLVEK